MTLFIAEIGNNHNGSLGRAKSLIISCKEIGADIVKFQLRDFDKLYRQTRDDVEDLGVEYVKDVLRKYELDADAHFELYEFCREQEIEYMCTPWDENSVEFLERLGVRRYKVASADFNNLPLINRLLKTGKEIIFSTGMANIAEIQLRARWLKKMKANFSLLHCNSTYPAPFEDIQLEFIENLLQITPKVGYSGHERGIAVSLAAVTLGATIIERHITEDKSLEGPDHQASLLPEEFAQLIQMSAEIKKAYSFRKIPDRKLSQGALLNKENLGKSIVAARDLDAGTILDLSCLEIRSPGQGITPDRMSDLIGKRIIKPVHKHDFLFENHFSEKAKTSVFRFKEQNWGIPVRPHDVMFFSKELPAPVYEFHISYNDLTRNLPDEPWDTLAEKKILLHAPELFSGSYLLDLTCDDNTKMHIDNLNLVCNYARKLRKKIGYKKNIEIITNIGGFSTHDFLPEIKKDLLYERIEDRLQEVNQDFCEIIIQNMAPFPWHFGGQRYQNIFAYTDEIVNFCAKNNARIALDTAHLSMHCQYRRKDFYMALSDLAPFVAHWHISDAAGTNGEGVQLGTGDIDFSEVLPYITAEQSFIVETWQGHKNAGEGFRRDLEYLNGLELK